MKAFPIRLLGTTLLASLFFSCQPSPKGERKNIYPDLSEHKSADTSAQSISLDPTNVYELVYDRHAPDQCGSGVNISITDKTISIKETVYDSSAVDATKICQLKQSEVSLSEDEIKTIKIQIISEVNSIRALDNNECEGGIKTLSLFLDKNGQKDQKDLNLSCDKIQRLKITEDLVDGLLKNQKRA